MDSFQRSFAPPYQKNSTLIPMSSPDENGKFKYYNFSFNDQVRIFFIFMAKLSCVHDQYKIQTKFLEKIFLFKEKINGIFPNRGLSLVLLMASFY